MATSRKITSPDEVDSAFLQLREHLRDTVGWDSDVELVKDEDRRELRIVLNRRSPPPYTVEGPVVLEPSPEDLATWLPAVLDPPPVAEAATDVGPEDPTETEADEAA